MSKAKQITSKAKQTTKSEAIKRPVVTSPAKPQAKPQALPQAQPQALPQTQSMSVQLSQLVASPANIRKVYSEGSLNELAASLAAVGQIQDIRVRKNPKGQFEVVAGGRRFHALKLLMRQKRSVKGVKVTGAFMVRVTTQTSDDSDVEIGLHENRQREDMHPADECKAFEALHNEGKTPEAIADRFGISHMTVRRRLKLAKISPRIMADFADNRLSLEQMEALAVSDDHASQEDAFYDRQSWETRPFQIKHRLTHEKLRSDSPLLKLVGLEAYKAHGGTITRDLFDDSGSSFCDNRELAVEMAGELLAADIANYEDDGWKWVEGNLNPRPDAFNRIHPVQSDYSDDDRATLHTLNERVEALHVLAEESDLAADMDDDEQQVFEDKAFADIAAIEAEISTIQRKYVGFDPIEKTFAGVMICVSHAGELVPFFGLLKPDDHNALRRAEKSAASAGSGNIVAAGEHQDDAVETGVDLSAAMVEDLTALKTAALGVELAKRPEVAICALLHPLLISLFYTRNTVQSACEIRDMSSTLRQSTPDYDNQTAFIENEKMLAEAKAELPDDVDQLWAWLMASTLETQLCLLAVVTSQSVNAWQQRHMKHHNFKNAEQIAKAVNLDMRNYWKPSNSFFARVTKAVALSALRDTHQPTEFIAAMDKTPKKDTTPRIIERLAGHMWLPEVLRPKAPEPDIAFADGDDAENELLQAFS